MRRALALFAVGAALLAAAACGDKADTVSPSAAPATSASVDVKANTAAACTAADALYATLEASAKAEITKGIMAAASGDKASADKALAALKPVFAAAATTLKGEAGKAADPEVKKALTDLADSYEAAQAFKSFDEFESLAAQSDAAEASLKKLCTDAGVPLKNFE